MAKKHCDLFEARFYMDKPVLQWDRATKGLGIRMNVDGTRVFIAKIAYKKKPKWLTLGPCDEIRVEAARKLVTRMKQVARIGEDPTPLLAAFWKDETMSPQSGITFGAFLTKYLTDYAMVYKKSWVKDKQRVELYLMPTWGDRLLKEITRDDFKRIFTQVGRKRPIAANRLKETVTTMFKQAVVMGYLDYNRPLPTYLIRSYPEKSRRNKIDLDQLPALGLKIKQANIRPVFKYALLFILHTALRHSEVISLKWSYFDFGKQIFIVPATKNGKPHTLPITNGLKTLLDSMPRTGPYLFPSPFDRKKHVYSLTKAWHIVRAGGFDQIWIHDLRRSVGCIMLEQTNSISAVRDVLNHSHEHVSAIYGFYGDKGLRPIMERFSNVIAKALEV